MADDTDKQARLEQARNELETGDRQNAQSALGLS